MLNAWCRHRQVALLLALTTSSLLFLLLLHHRLTLTCPPHHPHTLTHGRPSYRLKPSEGKEAGQRVNPTYGDEASLGEYSRDPTNQNTHTVGEKEQSLSKDEDATILGEKEHNPTHSGKKKNTNPTKNMNANKRFIDEKEEDKHGQTRVGKTEASSFTDSENGSPSEARSPFSNNEDMDLIFVGGVPRSGTTLMRVMLDAHPQVRCGMETRVIPRLLALRAHVDHSPTERIRLQQAGVTPEVMDSAVRAFIIEIITKHGEPAPRLCNKDPFTLKSAAYLSGIFPGARFLLMLRDGRAVVHSIISRHVTILGFDLTSFRKCLHKWNSAIETMYLQCQKVGPERCLPVYYEQLALHPKQWMEKILSFLRLPWNSTVLHHHDFIGDSIALSTREKSTDQVLKPVNIEALTRWVGHVPSDVMRDIETIAPMLRTLGYDPTANPPDYGKPDPQVALNTRHIQHHADFWRQKEEELFDKLGGRPQDNWSEEQYEDSASQSSAPTNNNVNSNHSNNNDDDNNYDNNYGSADINTVKGNGNNSSSDYNNINGIVYRNNNDKINRNDNSNNNNNRNNNNNNNNNISNNLDRRSNIFLDENERKVRNDDYQSQEAGENDESIDEEDDNEVGGVVMGHDPSHPHPHPNTYPHPQHHHYYVHRKAESESEWR